RFPPPCARSPVVAVINANAEPAARIVIWAVRERNIILDPFLGAAADYVGSVRAAKRSYGVLSPADRRILVLHAHDFYQQAAGGVPQCAAGIHMFYVALAPLFPKGIIGAVSGSHVITGAIECPSKFEPHGYLLFAPAIKA